MKYRRCGNSGVLLPVLSLGMWKNFGETQTFNDSLRMLHYAFDQGMVHFDLANNYGPPYGAAEATLGRALDESLRPHRDELFISTKAGYDMWPGPYGNWGSRKYLMASLDQSLRRMRLDYVDLFYIHRYDPDTPLEETLQALVDIVRRGKALYIGISRWPEEALEFGVDYLKARDVPCLAYQGRLNLLQRESEADGAFRVQEAAKFGIVTFSPLAQGLLSDRYLGGVPSDSRMRQAGSTLTEDRLTPQLQRQLAQLNSLAAARGETLACLSLRWVLQHEGVTSAIVGASRISQLQDNLKAIEGQDLSDEELRTIETILAEP